MTIENLLGYHRSDGSYGIRNYVVALAAADNVNPIIYKLGKMYPELICIPATFGRGQMGNDLEVTLRAMAGIASHPNVFGTLIVSYEPESGNRIISKASMGRHIEMLSILEVGGYSRTIEQASGILEDLLTKAKQDERVLMPWDQLVIGLECGGSDTTSGLISNPTVGRFVDEWIGRGGTAVFSEPVELMGCENILDRRSKSPEIAKEIRLLINEYQKIAIHAGVDLVGINPTSDNIAGGLSSIQEKSLGALAKTGSVPIEGVLKYAEAPKNAGLWLMDAPAAAVENLTALSAGGCHMILFTTGSVNPVGSAVAPTIKICGNPHSKATMGEHIDVDLSGGLDGSLTNEQAVDCIRGAINQVIKGHQTCSEKLGFVETRISRIGLSV